MSFKEYLKKKLKYVLSIATMAAIVSQFLLPAFSTSAAEPRFNFLEGDKELIRGANITKGDTIFQNPIAGIAGDEFRALIYYHNGVVDTAATNTKIKVNIPSATTNKSAKITATISADNAASVSSTIVDGVLVGHDGLIVNLDQNANLEFIPGSAKWFPDANELGSSNPTPFPNNQTGNEIVGANGVNIGTINGCWQFAGFVSFGFKTKVVAAPKLELTKTVRNMSANETAFAESTNAAIGDDVEFKINVKNSGNIVLKDALLVDDLPIGLIFEPGSLREGTSAINDTDAMKLLNAGLNIGDIAQGVMRTFTFQAKVSKSAVAGSLVNVATVSSMGLTATDKATVNVQIGKIEKSKSAFNDTKKHSASTVSPEDLITYTLNAKNSGSAPVEFVFEDDISSVLNFAQVVSVSDNGQIIEKSSQIVWPSVKVNAGQTVKRTFQIKIKKDAPAAQCFRNVFGNEVVLCIEKKEVHPNLSIEKLVRDISTGETSFMKANQAFAGDTLEYEINFSNCGDGPADQVIFADMLPVNTKYIAGTTRLSRNGGAEQTLNDGITESGIVINTIAAGETDSIKFRVTVSSGVAAGEVLVNKASLTDEGKTILDTAKTTIIAKAVPAAPVTELPKTGATGAGSFIVTFLAGIGFLYGKYRMMLNGQEVSIIADLLS